MIKIRVFKICQTGNIKLCDLLFMYYQGNFITIFFDKQAPFAYGLKMSSHLFCHPKIPENIYIYQGLIRLYGEV